MHLPTKEKRFQISNLNKPFYCFIQAKVGRLYCRLIEDSLEVFLWSAQKWTRGNTIMSLCKACSEALFLRVASASSDDGEDEDTQLGASKAADIVPDDLELPCHCHFHW